MPGGTSEFLPHPHPSQVPPSAQVGGGGGWKPSYGTLERTPGEGHCVGSQPEGCNFDGRTTGDQTLLKVDGQLHRKVLRGGNNNKGERIRAKFIGGQGTGVNLGGGVRGDQKHRWQEIIVN